jgi:hypothetical protein
LGSKSTLIAGTIPKPKLLKGIITFYYLNFNKTKIIAFICITLGNHHLFVENIYGLEMKRNLIVKIWGFYLKYLFY